ncbi:hypothetical protein BDV38DRAFT_146160 [Aspergillus pseudotamarii]|uniref:Uncharacterized protein n=1 Tax=Aspergillus pseudotamarii TaxID=132259 RepID=A0A5N6SMI4_ASPPS|nr:uncharacterized protein BDV38DRAFT_146160 [Aspergillus pseudotamarii]KAE8134980.1 hypothetical protein BDV38DRAFT_146160 [Aspergillus pseudotamarii]
MPRSFSSTPWHWFLCPMFQSSYPKPPVCGSQTQLPSLTLSRGKGSALRDMYWKIVSSPSSFSKVVLGGLTNCGWVPTSSYRAIRPRGIVPK